MKRSLYKYACVLLCFILCCAFCVLSAAAQETQTKLVRVGWYEDAYNITGTDGERSGYGYEFQQSVAAYTGWKYEYVRGGWSDLLVRMKNGEFDVMSGVSYTDERAKTMLFSELPMGEEKYYLYADLTHADISASDLKTLNGKRIGLLKESVQATQFFKWEKEHGLHVQHVYLTSFEDAKEKVAQREVDGVISTETPQWVESGMSAIATVGSSGIYFAINKNRPDLKADLDDAMRKMEYDKPFYANELYQRYLSAVSSAVLSTEEKQWLAGHGAIRIGWLNHDMGISNLDEKSGKPVGVIADYIKFAADCLENQPLAFELVEFNSLDEQMQALKEHKIDMIFHFSQNLYVAEQNDFILSNTVLAVNMAAVTAKSYFDENAENSVAIEKDNKFLKWYVSYNYPKWKIKEYASVAEVEQAVSSGEADCFIAKPGQLTKYIENNKFYNVFLTRPGNMSFAVTRGNTLLLSVLNKTLKTMPSTMLTGALSMYDNTLKKVTMMDFVKDNLVAVGITFTTIFAVVLLLILSFLRKSREAEARTAELNKKLQESHTELEEALARAEKASSAKTTFLFNMSHDIRTPMNALLGYSKLMKSELHEPKLLNYQAKMEQAGNLLLSIINNVLDMARIESGKIEMDETCNRISHILDEICGVFEEEAKKKGLRLIHGAQIEHDYIMCDVTKVKEIFANLISNAIKYTPAGGTVILRLTEIPATKEGYVRVKTEVIDDGIGMSKEFLPKLFESFSRERNTTIGKVAGTGLGTAIVRKLVDMMGGSITVKSELGKGSKFTVILEHKIADESCYKEQKDVDASGVQKELIFGKRLLLAEDNDLNAEIAMVILGRMGLEVERVEDGAACVRKLEEKPAGTYDLILMDIQMPNMDGYAATRAIRALSDKAKADIPIVAMTANAFEEDKENALKAGMNGHIAKPIDVAKVEHTLLSLFK